jgi:peroxiredoxin
MALIVGVWMGAPARAEFSVGDEIPGFSLKTTDGKAVEVRRADEKLTVQLGDERIQPKAVVIHLLQPDCPQCRAQLQALKPLAARLRERGVLTLGIAHRGTAESAGALVKDVSPGFPIAVGVDSDVARKFAAGDTLGIADAGGVVRFAQVGFGEGDQKLWEQALEELVAGKDVTKLGVERERLAAGDSMPAIRLHSLRNDKPMSLSSENGRLVFRDDAGKESKPKGVIFFFSRY